MASAVAPMLAPMLGGTLDELYGWRASFWAFLVMGGATLALCWLDLRETNKTPAAGFSDIGRGARAFCLIAFWGSARFSPSQSAHLSHYDTASPRLRRCLMWSND